MMLLTSPAWAVNSFHLTQSLMQVAVIAQDFGIIMGLGLFAGGLFKLKRYGEMRTMMSSQMTIAKPLFMMFSGIALICLPVMTATLLQAIWGTSSPLAYPVYSSYDFESLMTPIIVFIRLVGVFGIIRGFILLSRAGNEQGQPGQVGKAILHLVGGIMCVHIIGVSQLIENIFNVN